MRSTEGIISHLVRLLTAQSIEHGPGFEYSTAIDTDFDRVVDGYNWNSGI